MNQQDQTNIFISRQLQPDSIFLQRLSAEGFRVHGESLVIFQPLAFEWPQDPAWVFFYSRHAVQFFFDQLDDLQKLQGLKLAAMGSGTAEQLSFFCPVVHFTGAGEPEAVAAAFGEIAEGEVVLFPRARHSRRSVQQLLGERIQAIDLITYDNLQRTDLDLPICQALVFTSPMNAEAYFQTYSLQEGQEVYAIGQVTARRLQQLGVAKIKVAAEPSEEGLAEVVLRSVL